MSTYIWLDNECDDPRFIVVVAGSVQKARENIINQVLPDVRDEAFDIIGYEVERTLKGQPQKIAELKRQSKERNADAAEHHLRVVISYDPDVILENNETYRDGWFHFTERPFNPDELAP